MLKEGDRVKLVKFLHIKGTITKVYTFPPSSYNLVYYFIDFDGKTGGEMIHSSLVIPCKKIITVKDWLKIKNNL